MLEGVVATPVLLIIGWCLWVRRHTWRLRWDRALTMCILFQGIGFALCMPYPSYLGKLLFALTGIAHLRDFIGHLFLISGTCAVIYTAACRLLPDSDLDPLLRKIEVPSAVAAFIMLACRVQDPLRGKDQPNFLEVGCDGWLTAYWLTLGAIEIYLAGYLIRLMLAMRACPRSRVTTDMFTVAAVIGIVSIAALIARTIAPSLNVSSTWLWAALCASSALVAAAAIRSWNVRRAPFTHPEWNLPMGDT
ncbi:hypothetical protein AWB90_16000 [Mycobacterium paraense]|uniref:Uncharacterized protein n=1 Tax=Mycobacterium paraense TaxID=767916 RepID=A0A1X2A8Y2_9MYCO|nr:hypothetical protein [Mycobacterium paraense]ORW44918.1 hypothetical protein AWB90_16000 [Mycobacterium paraense]